MKISSKFHTVILGSSLVLAACGDKGGGDGSSHGNLALILKNASSTQQFGIEAASTASEVRDNDSTGAPSTHESGYCFTPVNILGSLQIMNIGPLSGAGVRLLGGSETVSGIDAVMGFNKFDLLAAEPFDGADNIQDGLSGDITVASLSYYHLESVFGAAGETWHVRYMFYNSTPSEAAPFLGCEVGASELAVLDAKAESLIEGVAFKKYDVMACLEVAGTETSKTTLHSSGLTWTMPTTLSLQPDRQIL